MYKRQVVDSSNSYDQFISHLKKGGVFEKFNESFLQGLSLYIDAVSYTHLCRVSSDSSDQMNSFAAQIKYYTDYSKVHTEYELVDIYADEGI